MELLSKMGPPLREDMEGSEETGLRHTALVVRSQLGAFTTLQS